MSEVEKQITPKTLHVWMSVASYSRRWLEFLGGRAEKVHRHQLFSDV